MAPSCDGTGVGIIDCSVNMNPECVARLARIEVKLDMVLDSERDKERRIRVLEKRDAMVMGASVVVSLITSSVVPILIQGIAKRIFP